MKRLLFFSYGGDHGKLILQLLRTIRNSFQDKYTVLNVGLTTAAQEFRESGYPANGFAEYAESESDAEALALGGYCLAWMANLSTESGILLAQ